MDKKLIIIFILLIMFGALLFTSVKINCDHKKYVKELKMQSDSIAKENVKLDSLSSKLKKEIADISNASFRIDSVLNKQKEVIYYLAVEKNRISKQRDSLKNDINKIIDADSTTIESYRSKYFKLSR
jgi:hypothetical protein